jgi:hypothetical protein
MLMVWNRYEVSDVESLSVYAESSTVLSLLAPVFNFGVLCPLASVGVVLTFGQRRLWVFYVLIVSMACAVALFYVMVRYRFPLVPLLIPFAGAGCVRGWDALRGGNRRALGWSVVVGLIVAGVVNMRMYDEERLDAMARMNAGVAIASTGNIEAAAPMFRSAVAVHPGSAEALNNLAQASAMLGDFGEAVVHYRVALALSPDLTGVDYNLGVSLERLGRADEALVHFRRAVDLDAGDVEAAAAERRLGG